MSESSSKLDPKSPGPDATRCREDSSWPAGDRFFVDAPLSPGRVLLEGPEAHHMTHVLRMAVGEKVTLFDGRGTEGTARVASINRRRVELDVLELRRPDRELPVRITLAVALPKGDRQKWLVEKAVELGVACLVPLRTARSVAQPDPHAIRRLARQVVEASKQCGRNRLMEIAAPSAWLELVGSASALRLLAHPGGSLRLVDVLPQRLPESVFLAVGPEGGFTRDEVDQATAAGWQPVDLGPRVLRIETAALALVAQVAGRAG